MTQLINIFLDDNNKLTWKWSNIASEDVEDVLLDVLKAQIAYNLKKAANKKQLITPSLGQIVGINNNANL